LEAAAPTWKSGKSAGAYEVDQTASLRRSSLAVYALETLLQYARRHSVDGLARAQSDLAARRAREKEFSLMRDLWRAHFDLLSELDSVRMAKMAVSLAENQAQLDAMAPEIRNAHVLPSHLAVDDRIREAVNELRGALLERRGLRSKFRHLLHRVDDRDTGDECTLARRVDAALTRRLEDGTAADVVELNPPEEPATKTSSSQQQQEEDASPSTCAVCLQVMPMERAVLSHCGHEFCGPCVRAAAAASNNGLKCPTCRSWHVLSSVHFTLALKSAASKQVRTFGTKVSALVADVAAVPEGDKVLVFAEWESTLEVVVAALRASNVTFERPTAKSGKQWDATLRRFRQENVKALVLNVRAAGAGLTLVEANHVYLLHPLLSKADEAQAIGRVHRIGQTKAVVVKRFLIDGTVEIGLLHKADDDQRSGGEAKDDVVVAEESPKRRRRTSVASPASTGSYVNRAAAQAVRSREDLRHIFDLTGDDLRRAGAELFHDDDTADLS